VESEISIGSETDVKHQGKERSPKTRERKLIQTPT